MLVNEYLSQLVQKYLKKPLASGVVVVKSGLSPVLIFLNA